MAEGNPVHEQLSVEGGRSRSLDSLLLECPICLEQLRQPKSLPCLHSFCQECLGSYITKELSGMMASTSSFSCPVCRKVIEPMNPSEDKESWAEQFPTNNLVVEMTRHLQKTSEPILCKPCARKGMNVSAKFWCRVNNSYFCATCKINIHDLCHEECQLEEIVKFNKMVLMRREVSASGCGKHKENMEYYCEDHQCLGCSKCIIIDHLKCDVVVSAKDFRDNLTKSSKIDDLLEELRKCVDTMEMLIKDVDEQLQSMTQSQNTTLQSLADLRKKINERLDTLQKELTEKMEASFKEEKENLNISRKRCERLMFAMQNTLTTSKDVTLKDDTIGTICMFQRGQAEVQSCKDLVQELDKSSRSTILTHVYDADILDTLDSKTSLTMGNIIVHQKQRRLPSNAYITSLSKCQLKKKGAIYIKLPSDKRSCNVRGIVLLSGGRIVVGDYGNRKVKLFTENGDCQSEMKLTEKSCDMCRIDDDTVAVMLTTVKTICVVNVGNMTLTISLNVQIRNISEDCLGVTYINNSFVVGTASSLYNVPISGEVTKILTNKSTCLHLTSNQKNGQVFASFCTDIPDKVAVTRLHDDGTCTAVLKVGDVQYTAGIDIDREGKVYVCGCRSNNVIQMSGDGTNVRELLTSSDGIKQPRVISVWDDKFVIGFEEADFVHMFQLD